MSNNHHSKLKYRHLGIETQHERIVFMRSDCNVCLAEGFEALTRVQVRANGNIIVASLNVLTHNHLLKQGEVGLSNSAALAMGVKPGDELEVGHLDPLESHGHLRAKIYGNELTEAQYTAVVKDIVNSNYSNIHLSAFITACSGDKLSIPEIISIAKAMVNTGSRMKWDSEIIMDKHCVGGLPGNRTTPIVVAIIAAAGLIIPKTSSRAITSPAGTADTMECMSPVNLSQAQIKEVVKKENGCIAWGGNAGLSPADDILIRVEKALDIDSEGQMVASVLSKKVAAGSTHVVIDIPVGPTAKVRSEQDAQRLKYLLVVVGKELGLTIKVVITDGTQPVGKGIGPALEALDVLSVLRNEKNAPAELRKRAIRLSGQLLEMAEAVPDGFGESHATNILESGEALKKFLAICKAQGGFREPEKGRYSREVVSESGGTITKIDNRILARIAKLAGAPADKGAGVWFNAPLGKKVKKGEVLFTVFADSEGELDYAMNYLITNHGKNIIRITG